MGRDHQSATSSKKKPYVNITGAHCRLCNIKYRNKTGLSDKNGTTFLSQKTAMKFKVELILFL